MAFVSGRRKAKLVILLVTFLVFCHAMVPYADDVPTEDQVKAAFVYNFIRFVEWPEDRGENGPIRLFVLGNSPLVAIFEDLEGKKINSKPLQVDSGEKVPDLSDFHVLYIAGDYRDREVSELLRKLKSVSVLTVSDRNEFVDQGGIIELVRAGNKVRFKINLGVARAAHLKISSKLLKLAIDVAD